MQHCFNISVSYIVNNNIVNNNIANNNIVNNNIVNNNIVKLGLHGQKNEKTKLFTNQAKTTL